MLRWKSVLTEALTNSRLAKGVRRRKRQGFELSRRMRLESLEDRRMLAVITVTSNANTFTDDGFVTLREAIFAADTDTSVDGSNAGDGVDTIVFDPAVFTGGADSLIRLTGTELLVTESLMIDGSGATDVTITGDADGNDVTLAGFITDVDTSLQNDPTSLDDNSRVINVVAGADLQLIGLTITGGRTTDNDAAGGGIFARGASLTLTDSSVSGNSTSGDRSSGGGIHARGLVTLTNATVSGNTTSGYRAFGGGVYSADSVTATNSAVSGNSTTGIRAFGGGIAAESVSSLVTLTNTTINNNSTAGERADGGGVLSSNIVATNSTISGNTTSGIDGQGGGVHAFNDLTLTNSTVSGNSTSGNGANGGGVVVVGEATISNSTITDNNAMMADGGGFFQPEGTRNPPLTISNSIVAGNSAGGTGEDLRTDPDSTLTASYNLIQTLSGLSLEQMFALVGGDGNLTGMSPLLGALADNGGPTLTHALMDGSPAIDAGDPAIAANPAEFDQRGNGFLRVVDGGVGGMRIDIGAFEFVPSSVVDVGIALNAQNELEIAETGMALDVENDLTIAQVGNELVITSATQTLGTSISGASGSGTSSVRVPIGSIAGNKVIANLGGGDDRLTVDFTSGAITVPIEYNGEAPAASPGDSLRINGGTAATVTHTFANASDGAVAVDFNGGVESTITYTGLEPILDNLNAAVRVFTFLGGAETITLSDDGTANDNMSLIDSTLGESVTFPNPTAALTINAGSGIDTVNVDGIDGQSVIPNLTINGNAEGDTIDLTGIAAGLFGSITLNGGAGDDTITGSEGDDTINGGADDDMIDGRAGNDTIVGTQGADSIVGGSGDDGITVAPATMAIDVDGEAPTVAPGDTLTVDLAGTTGATLMPMGGSAGQITFTSGEAPIDFVDIENLDVINGTLIIPPPAPINTGAGDDNILVTLDGNEVVVTVNAVEALRQNLTFLVGPLVINGEAGNDTLTVDSSSGLIAIDNAIRFDGGSGNDRINVVQVGGPAITSESLFIGSSTGHGIHQLLTASTMQRIEFDGLEPFTTNVAAPTFNITSVPNLASLLQDDNQISYEQGTPALLGPNAGRVTVDSFEPIEFINKMTLVIDAGAGSDEISTNNANTPTGLTGITINGGDPTAGSDRAIISGTTGGDSINFSVTTDDDAVVTGAGPVPITLATVESAVIDGQGVGDLLTYTTPVGPDGIIFTPGPNFAGSGSIVASSAISNDLMPIQYTDFVSGGPAAEVQFADVSGTRVDTLKIQGTSGNDSFEVLANGQVAIRDSFGLPGQDVGTLGVALLTMQGLSGDDVFLIPGNHPFPGFGGLTPAIIIEGGSPDNGGDLLNFTGNGAAVTADLGFRTIIETGFAPVTFAGIETVNINAGAAALTATLTSGDDELSYRPTGAAAGTFQNVNDNTTFNFTNVTGTFTVNEPAGATSTDLLIVEGTNNRDSIAVDAATRTVSVTEVNGTLLQPVTLGNGVGSVLARGRLGNDTIQVTPAPTVGGAPAGSALLIDVDGGEPGASDALVIATGAGNTLPATDFVVHAVGLNPGEGRVRVYRNAVAMPDISYRNVEVVTPNVAVNAGVPQLLVFGPDASEPNEFLTTATHLGTGESINVDNLAIFPVLGEHPGVPADVDFFQAVAQQTGTLDVTAFFEIYDAALLPGGGQLGLRVLDAAGNVIGGGTFGNPDATPNARVRVPVVAGQTYFINVFGENGMGVVDASVINGYELSITNEAPPVPFDLELNDILQVGTVNNAVVPTATVFRANIAPANGVLPPPTFDYVGKTIEFTSGINIGRSAVIAAFNNGTGQFTVGLGLLTAPAVNDTFIIETTDTGRSQFDDTTRDNTPIVTFRLNDNLLLLDQPGNPVTDTPTDEVIPIPFNPSQAAALAAGAGFRVPVFIEGAPQQPGQPPLTPVGYAVPLAGVPGVYRFDFGTDAIGGALPLADGSHFISAGVEIIDPATPGQFGYGERSQSFEIVVDTVAPLVSFGSPLLAADGLHADSDTGVLTTPTTFIDRITSDTTPTFFGRAEANSVVKAYVDLDGSGTITAVDVLIGETVAIPLDGTNQEPFGRWEITSGVHLNDTGLITPPLVLDGPRTILVSAEDLAGNVSAAAAALTIFVDTQGPMVAAVSANAQPDTGGGSYDLFDPKPSVNGPSPLVNSITINFVDFPGRIAGSGTVNGFLYPALDPVIAGNVGNYSVVGDHNGQIGIIDVTVDQALKLSGALTAVTDATNFTDAGLVAAMTVPEVGDFITFNNGATFGLWQRITAFNPATGAITVDLAAGGGPAVGDGYSIVTAASLSHAVFPSFNTTAQETVTGAINATSFFAANITGGIAPVVGDYIRFNTGLASSGSLATPVIRRVTAFNAATGQITLDSALPAAPVAGDGFSLIGGVNSGPFSTIAPRFANTASVTLTFAAPLPDDRFTLTISDNLVDPAGNKLDGESDADQPLDNPTLSGFGFSGDGVPGGDFVGRFTIDTRPEIGVWAAGIAAIDINGNLQYDPENVDATNRDINFQIGFSSDNIFAGKFGRSSIIPTQASGFDTLAAYGRVGNQWRWMIDTNHDGVITAGTDIITNDVLNINGLPVAGNFDGNLLNGDEIGVFDGITWYLDTNRNFMIDAGDTTVASNYSGFPIVGDFNGDGIDDLGAYTAVTNQFGGNLVSIDTNMSGTFNTQFRVGSGGGGANGFNMYPGVRERAVAADMDADGVDDIGFWVPDGATLTPSDQGEWYFFVSGGASLLNRVSSNFLAYTPTPFGPDFSARFGNSFAWPIVGNFDPPIVAAAGASPITSPTSSASEQVQQQEQPPATVPATESPEATGLVTNQDQPAQQPSEVADPTAEAPVAAESTNTTTTSTTNTTAPVEVEPAAVVSEIPDSTPITTAESPTSEPTASAEVVESTSILPPEQISRTEENEQPASEAIDRSRVLQLVTVASWWGGTRAVPPVETAAQYNRTTQVESEPTPKVPAIEMPAVETPAFEEVLPPVPTEIANNEQIVAQPVPIKNGYQVRQRLQRYLKPVVVTASTAPEKAHQVETQAPVAQHVETTNTQAQVITTAVVKTPAPKSIPEEVATTESTTQQPQPTTKGYQRRARLQRYRLSVPVAKTMPTEVANTVDTQQLETTQSEANTVGPVVSPSVAANTPVVAELPAARMRLASALGISSSMFAQSSYRQAVGTHDTSTASGHQDRGLGAVDAAFDGTADYRSEDIGDLDPGAGGAHSENNAQDEALGELETELV